MSAKCHESQSDEEKEAVSLIAGFDVKKSKRLTEYSTETKTVKA